ncbi:MAG: hypothetical protein NC828_03280, partial [Candidatus Omnitrophica bacterium]|nr:hypothetical protein [Candidatus Omnitrophota bacterium]
MGLCLRQLSVSERDVTSNEKVASLGSSPDSRGEFAFGKNHDICLGINKTEVTFQKEGRFAKGWVIEIRPAVVKSNVWVDPEMVGYDF